MSGRLAAFFDLDGTLLPLPSLERRFLRALRFRGEIPLTNYFLWCREAMKLLARGSSQAIHANKMYLRGLDNFIESGVGNQIGPCASKSGHPSQVRASEEGGQAKMPPRPIPRWPVPHFFEDGVERVAWHAMQEHAIVIVSGTLEPLANAAAQALKVKLAERGFVAGIRVCATKLEESEGQWTGRVLGEAMFGKAKARAVFSLAEEMKLDLSQSWAYGDSAQDRWMLDAIGNPVAVNPSARLTRVVKKHGWPVLRWRAENKSTQSLQRTQRKGSRSDEVLTNECALRGAERCP